MERQSSRIYFQGHYHKDIYFQGHYHKAMYLTDSAGNATLVWEKIRGTPPARISLIESIGDRYYGIGSIKGGYYGWGDLFEADSPYGLILAERSGRRDQVIIIREPDGIIALGGMNFNETFDSLSGDRHYNVDFIPSVGSRLDLSGTTVPGMDRIYRIGETVIRYKNGGSTIYGHYMEAGNDTKIGFHLQHRSMGGQYTRRDITVTDSRVRMTVSGTFVHCGKVFLNAGYRTKHEGIAVPFVILDEGGDRAEVVEMGLSAVQEQYVRDVLAARHLDRYPPSYIVSVTDVSLSVPAESGIRYPFYDFGRGEMSRVISIGVRISVTIRQTGGEETRTSISDTSAILKADLDFDRMCVSGVRVLEGRWGYNDDYNLMEHGSHRLWFRRRKPGGDMPECRFLVYEDGKERHEMELERRDELLGGAYRSLYYVDSNPFSCFFAHDGYLYFGLHGWEDYFARIDTSENTYVEVEKNIFVKGG